jgi:hypothetical protein
LLTHMVLNDLDQTDKMILKNLSFYRDFDVVERLK